MSMVEPHEQVKNGQVLKFIKEYWFLALFFGGLVFAWSEMRAQILAQEQINAEQKMSIDGLESSLQVLDRAYVQDVSIIKTKLDLLEKAAR